MKRKKNYTELSKLNSFKEKFEYLKLDGKIGVETFGHDRFLNQALYTSPEWKRVKNKVIIRDNGCDLGVNGYPIGKRPIIHHMNPITIDQIENRDPEIFDPEYLITVSHKTHNAIHYSDDSILIKNEPTVRKPGDTSPWRSNNER